MSVDRRSFLEHAAFALAAAKMTPHDWGAPTHHAEPPAAPHSSRGRGVFEMRGPGGGGTPLRWSVLRS